MPLTLHLENFRNIEKACISLDKVNYIYGGNGAGKTSILESIFLLNSLRSFRQQKSLDEATTHNQPFLFLQLDLGESKHLKLEKIRSEPMKLKINNEIVRSQFYLKNASYPTKVMSPHTDFFMNIDAEYRRSFFDWLVFHMKHDFYEVSSKYEVVLENRNAGLKSGNLNDDIFWIEQLALWGERTHALRQSVLNPWKEKVFELLEQTSLAKKVNINFSAGWASDLSLLDALKKSKYKDIERGYTNVGSHRCDLEITSHGIRATSIFSRGQLKLIYLAMIFAQLILLDTEESFLLIDDLGSELDGEALQFFSTWIKKYRGYLVISVIDRNVAEELITKLKQKSKLFCIEGGYISENMM